MAILRLEALRREIGDFVILDSIDAAVAHGERIGLVGANGAGKTTLLKLAAGADEPDGGRVIRKAGLRIGLLTQEANLDPVFAAAPSVRIGVRAGAEEVEVLEGELAAIESAGADAVESPRYAALRDRFEQLDGYHLDQRVEATLSGLGLTRDEWDRSPLELSGGEQTRAALARLVVSDPDLLMLDEPTNHLDLAALEWLEDALVRRSRALLVASHDRAFLDAVVQRVWELRHRRIEAFRGDYSAYLRQRAARDERLAKDAENSATSIARELELIQRYRSHRKYSKMHEHERRLEAIRQTAIDAPRKGPNLKLSTSALMGGGPVRSGDMVVQLRDLVVGFRGGPDSPGSKTPVLSIPRLEASRGDRIGIVGPNGAGKTTLLRTIAGELAPLEGMLKLGAAVQPAYLAQIRRAAFPGATVLDALLSVARADNGPARSYLARFLFRGEDVFKPVSELSGGERSRLELALLGIMPANLLLLDEPTNHLDIPAREALESFLRESPATLLVVSHDRRLLDGLCDRLWVVEGGGPGSPGRAAAFEGRYREWRAAQADGWTVAGELELQSRRLDGGRSPVGSPLRGAGRRNGGEPSALNGRTSGGRSRGGTGLGILPAVTAPRAAKPAALSKDAYRRQRSAVEEDLTRLGLRRTHLELALGDPAVHANFVELRRVTSELADVDTALAQVEDAWLALEERAPR
ncbi:MAG: ABC-F family ATP-binding cassette domain-containing protein [Chloroflexi bacterium]|nr:ABC-F family ATP-binding cassette domain-containing protein [Chloroflexota bacterium]